MAAPTSSFDEAGSRRVVREYRPARVPTKPEWLANENKDRVARLEQRMLTRSEDRSATYPSKPKRVEMKATTSSRFELGGPRQAVVEPFMGQVYVKIRKYVQTKDKHFWSSPRGINLRVKEWKQLVELMPVISEAVSDLEVSFFFLVFFFVCLCSDHKAACAVSREPKLTFAH